MTVVKPLIRIFDYNKAIEFYVGWLGFKVDWEHTFEPGTPKFMQITLRDFSLYLSEHHGDGSPGIHINIEDFKGLRDYHRSLLDQKYKYNRPGLETPEWNPKQIMVTVYDPFNNRLTFTEVPE
ncbi:MAG: glyoxalase superfamily protein [Bacteroidota bacterium]